jgi:hypothetical protein
MVTHWRSSFWGQLFSTIGIIIVLDFLSGFLIISDSYTSFRTPHYYYHHGLQPDQDTWAVWGSSLYPVKTNSLGMVDSAVYEVKLETNKQRLLILGDSHSEGVGVSYNKTFSGILSKRLQEDAEVLNASCISYSPKIEYLKAKFLFEKGLKVDHIIVFIDISDMQNELVYGHFEPKKYSWAHEAWYNTKFFLKKHSSIYYLTSNIINTRQSRQFLEEAKFFNEQGMSGTPANVIDLYASFFKGYDDKVLLSNPQFHGVGEWYYNDRFRELADRGIALGQDQILKLKDLCDAQNVDLSISVHPWQYQILKGNVQDYYVEKWGSFAKENDIGFINLFPLFITAQNPVITMKMVLIAGDNHWNQFGHALVADYLEGYLRKEVISQTK